MTLVMDPSKNACFLYIARCEASTNDTVHFCNSAYYSASDHVTMAMALDTQADDIDVAYSSRLKATHMSFICEIFWKVKAPQNSSLSYLGMA